MEEITIPKNHLMSLSMNSFSVIINPALSIAQDSLGARFSHQGIELPESLGLLAQSIGVRNAEHLLTALQEFPNAFEAILNLPREQYLKGRSQLIERLEKLLAARKHLYHTLTLPKSPA